METVTDGTMSGSFYIPDYIVHFLVGLTAPQPGEEVLSIGLVDPQMLASALEGRSRDVEFENVRGCPTSDELDRFSEQYDVILCAPPFGLSSKRYSDRSGESSEEFWLKWSIGHLSPNGRLTIIVPVGLLSNYSQQPIRRFLLEESGLQAILELPAGWMPSTAIRASILFITSGHEPSRSIRMFRLTDTENAPWDQIASQVMAVDPAIPQGVSGKAYSVLAAELDSIRLDAQYYDPKYTRLPVPDPTAFEVVKLVDLVEIRSGDRFSKEHLRPGGVPFLQVSSITPNGHLALRNTRTVAPDVAAASRGYSRSGDILMTVAGTVGKVAFLGDQTPATGVCIDTSLRRLRVRDRSRLLPEYLALYLRSRLAQLQIERRISGSVIQALSNPNLGQITVYLPDVRSQQEIVKDFREFSQMLTDRLLAGFPDAEQMCFVVDMSEGTEPSEDQGMVFDLWEVAEISPPSSPWQETVREEFPFPVARAFTVFDDESLSHSDRFQALIDVSEAVVYYLHSVLLADQLRRLRIDDGKLEERLEKSLTEYSIDRRLKFIFRMLSVAREDPNVDLFIPELVDAEMWVCSEIHNKLRNPSRHRVRAPEPQCRKAVQEYTPRLERLFQSLMPLKDYKLAQVTKLSVRASRFQHTIVSMMGNNNLFQSQVEDLEEALPADTDHVIIVDQDYNCLDLHPFYLLHAWERTGMHPHLCFLKQLVDDPLNQRLRVESVEGVGDTKTETDLGLNDLLATGIV